MFKTGLKLVSATLLAALVSSCTTDPETDTGPGSEILFPEGIPGGGAVEFTPGERPDSPWGEPVTDAVFAPVLFRFDSAKVDDADLHKIQAIADYLRRNPGYTLVIEGHCDERGTAAYNMALGERRAQAVRAELTRLGIDASRLNTLSYGEEKPASFGHTEADWRLNRRAEFTVFK